MASAARSTKLPQDHALMPHLVHSAGLAMAWMGVSGAVASLVIV
jgi:hypothetical protein